MGGSLKVSTRAILKRRRRCWRSWRPKTATLTSGQLVRAMSIFHQTNATRLKPWLCATTVPLFAFTRVSLGAQQPPWDECRAPKTEYEIPERNFFAANQRRRQSKDRPLVAAPPNPTDRRRGPPARLAPWAHSRPAPLLKTTTYSNWPSSPFFLGLAWERMATRAAALKASVPQAPTPSA